MPVEDDVAERESMVSSKRAIVVGGSVGGLFAAVLLQEANWSVTIYERASEGLQGRGAGLVAQSDVLSILQLIQRSDVGQTGVVAWERIFLNREGEILDTISTPQAQMSWDLLYMAFRSKVADSRYLTSSQVVGASTEGDQATVHFSDGSRDTADLVIGADGIGSIVRDVVAPGTTPDYAGYVAFRGLAPEKNLPTISAQVLLDRFTFYNAGRTQFLGYLVAGADGSTTPGVRRYNWVWYRPVSATELRDVLTSDTGQRRQFSVPAGALSRQTKEELNRNASEQLPAVCSRVVNAEERPFVQAIFDYESPSMVKGNVALLGDAAFVVRPHTAMGVSKAAGDAIELYGCLARHETVASALIEYDLVRRSVGTQIARYGRRLGASFDKR